MLHYMFTARDVITRLKTYHSFSEELVMNFNYAPLFSKSSQNLVNEELSKIMEEV